MTTVYFSYWCPEGAACGKNNRKLGNAPNGDVAFSKLLSHLVNSPGHGLTDDGARDMILAHPECIAEEIWIEEPPTQPSEGKAKGKGNGDGRAAPYGRRPDWRVEVAGIVASAVQQMQHEPASSSNRHETLQLQQNAECRLPERVLKALARSEAAARTAARMSRAAAAAFDEEASTFRDALDLLQQHD